MNCDEFINLFREALEGKVSDRIINDNINYYRSYINGEMRKGKSESEVIKGLGDPRLLAKTIEESIKFAEGFGNSYSEYDGNNKDSNNAFHGKSIRLPVWLFRLIILFVVIVVLIVLFNVAFFLAPFVIAFLLAGFIIREIRNWINRY